MEFELLVALYEEDESLEEQERFLIYHISRKIEIIHNHIDNENIMYLTLKLQNVEDIVFLIETLEDEILIGGVDADMIMTKSTMKELGLD